MGQCERPGIRNVPECVAAYIAIFAGIGERADADAIQNNPNNPFEWGHFRASRAVPGEL
jgi:hypothetical protein